MRERKGEIDDSMRHCSSGVLMKCFVLAVLQNNMGVQ